MNSIERRNTIVELLNSQGNVLVSDLANRFSVSEVTIRTDLRLLENRGILQRFHGGATKNNYVISERTIADNALANELQLEDRYFHFADPKKRIAHAAVSLIKEGDSIILDSGSTTMLIAEELIKFSNINVITNSLPAAFILSDNRDITLIVVGGTLRHKTRSMHGNIAEQSLVNIAADIMFVGADGIDADRGITTYNEGYSISHVMAKSARKVVTVLDSSKFERSGFNVILPLSALDMIITDSAIDQKYVEIFKNKNIELRAV